MALTEGDKAIIAQIAGKVSHQIITEVIEYHEKACPHGKRLVNLKFMLIGICVGSGVLGGAGAGIVMKLFMGSM